MILREWYVIFIKENFALNKANRFAARFFINPIISAIQLSNEENLGMARYRFRVFEYRPI